MIDDYVVTEGDAGLTGSVMRFACGLPPKALRPNDMDHDVRAGTNPDEDADVQGSMVGPVDVPYIGSRVVVNEATSLRSAHGSLVKRMLNNALEFFCK